MLHDARASRMLVIPSLVWPKLHRRSASPTEIQKSTEEEPHGHAHEIWKSLPWLVGPEHAGYHRRSADTYVEPNPLRAIQHAQQGSADVTIRTVSARNDMVSGGDVLVRIDPRQGLDAATLKIARNGTDVSTAFKKNGAGLLAW